MDAMQPVAANVVVDRTFQEKIDRRGCGGNKEAVATANTGTIKIPVIRFENARPTLRPASTPKKTPRPGFSSCIMTHQARTEQALKTVSDRSGIGRLMT